MYSFNEYDADIANTVKGNHNTTIYKCLGLIGELGELTIELLKQLELDPNSDNYEYEKQVSIKLNEFANLAEECELLKKEIRTHNIGVFNNFKVKGYSSKDITEELGGILWYLATLSNSLNTCLNNVAISNKNLLKARFNHNPNWLTDGNKIH